MHLLYWILCFVATFCIMEFMAWFSHKYIMHGFLWHLHEDHHKKDHTTGLREMTLSLFSMQSLVWAL